MWPLSSSVRRTEAFANMKCFTHLADDAVAICRNCSKALCPACANETSSGIACRGKCSEELEQLGAMMRASTAAHKINRGGAAYFYPAFLVVLGIVFLAEPLLSGRPPRTFPMVAGAAFTLFGLGLGVIQLVWRRRA